jgi:hypothetical protein
VISPTTKSQRQQILDLLRAARGGEVPSLALSRISLQYGARVKELRELGFQIQISNRTERRAGKVNGYFRMESAPGEQPHSSSNPTLTRAATGSFPEFGSLAPERYPD